MSSEEPSEKPQGNPRSATPLTPKLDFSFVDEWKEDWFCYWDDSYDMPFEPEVDFNFRPLLETAVSTKHYTFVTSPASHPLQESASIDDKEILDDLLQELLRLRPSDTNKTSPGSEGGPCQFVPFLVSWPPPDSASSSPNPLLTPLALLEHLGAHAEICNTIDVMNVDETLEDCGALRDYFRSKYPDHEEKVKTDDDAQKNSRDPLIFYAGSDKLNPVPYFIVGRLSHNLVGGYLSALVHT